MYQIQFIYKEIHIPLMMPGYLPQCLITVILHIHIVRFLAALTVKKAMTR